MAPRDAGPYGCLARHAATRATRRARPASLLVLGQWLRASTRRRRAPARRLASDPLTPSVAEGAADPAPADAAVPLAVRAAPGAPACLPCAASPHPAPHYT